MVSDNYKVLLNNNLTCINDNFFTFIEEHEGDDVEKLRLKRFSNHDFDTSFAITQIECRKKIRKKLPEIYGNKRFLFHVLLCKVLSLLLAMPPFRAKALPVRC